MTTTKCSTTQEQPYETVVAANDQTQSGILNTIPQSSSTVAGSATAFISPNSDILIKDYCRALFDELISILRKELPSIPKKAKDEDLKAIINWYHLGVLSKLPEKLMKKPWKENVCKWLTKQMHTQNQADKLLGILQTVQKHKKSVGRLMVSVDHDMIRLLREMLDEVSLFNGKFTRSNKKRVILFCRFIDFVDGTASIDPVKDWLTRNYVSAVDKFIGAIKDAKMGHWDINSSLKLERLKYCLWGLTTIRQDTFTRHF